RAWHRTKQQPQCPREREPTGFRSRAPLPSSRPPGRRRVPGARVISQRRFVLKEDFVFCVLVAAHGIGPAAYYSFELLLERQFSRSAGLGVAGPTDLLVNAHVIDHHLHRERRRLIGFTRKLSAHRHVHEDVERLIERSRPRIEVLDLRGSYTLARI